MAFTKEQFDRDVANHTMQVVHADGIHRHLRCSNNGSSVYHFDIVTWPGYLAISGDCGAFIFSRLRDMFSFFRSPDGKINPSYWSEKVEAADRAGVKEWDPDGFKERVKEDFDDRWDGIDDTAARDACWDELTEHVLSHAEHEHEAIPAMADFTFDMPNGEVFQYSEYWEMGVQCFTGRYLWCIHAIVWAINQWDAAQPKEADPSIPAAGYTPESETTTGASA